MYGYILQDWITIRGTQSGVSIIQSEADWMSFQPYGDIVLWLDTKAVTLAGLTSLTIAYETSPAKDDSLFTPMVSAVTLVAGTSPLITKVLVSQNPTVPLARYVRWKLIPNGTPTGEYGACFRIFASANAIGLVG
jgi:hypothetical protein